MTGTLHGDHRVLANRYRLIMQIGVGGMGAVYQAYDLCLGRMVAIKQLRLSFEGDPLGQRRFLREAETAAAMSHQNIVEIYDIGWGSEHRMFIVMEFLDGEDLHQTLRREGPMPWARVRRIATQLCRAIRVAHERGIIHRDLKPQNCFRVTRDEEEDFIKILDFGLAKPLQANPSGHITRTGEAMGTPSYMAPEYIEGKGADTRADLYALGVIIYQLLVGKVPFSSKAGVEVMLAQIHQGMPPLPPEIAKQVPDGVAWLLQRLLAFEPDKRFADVQEVALAIKKLRPDLPRSRALKQAEVSIHDAPTQTEIVAPARVRVAHAPQLFSPSGFRWTVAFSLVSLVAAMLSIVVKLYIL